jgi:glycosyltransferase involved in cell wall biosynthesis
MKFSIITAAYNAEATIEETLRSVADQTHHSVEHIVVDGGSHDRSMELVKAHLRHGGRYLSEPDKGLYDAMNKGLSMATGDIIGILNADDRFADRETLSELAKAFIASRTDAVLGDVAFFSPRYPERLIRRYRSTRFTPRKLGWGWMPAHPGMYLTRAAYQTVGNYRTDYRIASDFEFVVRAFAKHHLSFAFLPRILVEMRTGGVSTSGVAANLLINREVLRACRENGVYSNMLMIASKYPLKLLEYLR